MSWFYKPYVSAEQRRANAEKEARKLAKKGRTLTPVALEGKKIAETFWGKAWCDNLESYSDYSNRLPRGRTYLRNGSVIDLQIEAGSIRGLVSGSSIYEIKIDIVPLDTAKWRKVQSNCAGRIDSLIELLQGRFSSSVMTSVTDRQHGLFPKPAEIKMSCSCPDWAGLCKHLAACLYAVGARLDRQPDLLFILRGVNPAELIAAGSIESAVGSGAGSEAIAESDLAEVFGIEIAPTAPAAPRPKVARPTSKPLSKATKRPERKPARPSKPRVKSSEPDHPGRRLSAADHKRIVEAARRRWAAAQSIARTATKTAASKTRRAARVDK